MDSLPSVRARAILAMITRNPASRRPLIKANAEINTMCGRTSLVRFAIIRNLHRNSFGQESGV
jgi:hypothetical protein